MASAAVVLCVCAPAIAARAWDAPVFPLRAGWRLVQPPVRSGAWAAVVAADAPAPPDLPHSLLLIAHEEGGVWRVRGSDASNAADAAAFDAWIDALPPELLSAQDRAWFRIGDRARAARAMTAAGFRLPAPGGWRALLTQGPFGPFSHNAYWAIDLVLPYWGTYTPAVVAAKSGVVMYVKDVSDVGGLGMGYAGYANGVVIRHGPGEYSWYWHLAHDSVPSDVQPGRAIEAGAVIGRMGSTGYSSGDHLHFHVSESFVMAGCDAVLGCSARESNAAVAPWSRAIVPVDFEEVANEAAWVGCGSVAECGDLPQSANRLDASDGAVAYWSRHYDGPGWKMRASFAGDLPLWLAGRAESLALPAGWRATLYDRFGLQGAAFSLGASEAVLGTSPWSVAVAGPAPLPTHTPAPLPTATPLPTTAPTATPAPLPTATLVPLPSITPWTGRRVMKALRSDASKEWPYLLGGAHVAGIEVDGHLTLPGDCSWMVRSLSPGTHAVTFTLRLGAAETAAVEARRWPFEMPACMDELVAPGPAPSEAPCMDALDSYEPNGAAALAGVLVPGESQVHRAALAGDADWVTFSVFAGAQYELSTDALGAAADTVLELLDADGAAVLARSDDADGAGRASQIRWRAGSTGVRYARVRQWDPGAAGCGTNYVLQLIETKPQVWAPVIL